jgi:hypothetical protein
MPSEPVHYTHLFDALSAITVRGPDTDGLLWVSFQTDGGFGTFSLQADAAAGRAAECRAREGRDRTRTTKD